MPLAMARSTSEAITRPLGPLASHNATSNPASFASFLARGEAKTRSPDGSRAECVADVTAGGSVCIFGAEGAAAAGGVETGTWAEAGTEIESTEKSLKADTSCSSSTVTMSGAPTMISSVPTRILARKPSSCASKVTVALSVSTSQMA